LPLVVLLRALLRLTDHKQLFLFELPRLAGDAPATPLSQWLRFFDHAGTMAIPYSHPPVREAAHELRELGADAKERELARQRDMALSDEAALPWEAQEKGREMGAKKAAPRKPPDHGFDDRFTLGLAAFSPRSR